MIPRKYLILVSMSGMLVSFDQLTKFLVSGWLDLGQSVSIQSSFLNFTLVHNRGAAFGLFSNLPESIREPFFFVVPGITLVLIFFVFTRLREGQGLSIFALSMIVGGAMGNLMDRLRLGYVVDFIDFHWRSQAHFPAFNLADSSITLGVAMLFMSLLFEKEDAET